ncbi:MAG: orotidine-5'-phosphate decarboxylase [Desulfobacterales bacterium]|nr:orotidine-5'-phosphate decarboxylase [Desulfobacterales bacterium]
MKTASEYIVFPLDVSSEAEAATYVQQLCGCVGMFKVGLELFIRTGPPIVDAMKRAGARRIFLDLKLHDIPATVGRAMAAAADLGVDFVTVHCGESPRMLEAAVSGGGGRAGVLGVTVLTSVSPEEIAAAGFRRELSDDLNRLVMQRAAMARDTGCQGVVCSGLEVSAMKSAFGRDFLTVTPGIRPAWEGAGADDQRRVVTPAAAIAAGADYLVIGRPIRDASDPVRAAQRIAEEIHGAQG